MKRFYTDPLLIVLAGLLGASLLAFFAGLIPYPYGLFILGAFIFARILYLQGNLRGGG